ncbi:hypothetical protein [Paenibacillus lautus]|uniref:hypothetical protein n=1 Tax=Paenibacillus lautus TaxID=1401 RepID=UPI001C100260|nr:hypothetical protein [Paenibacillus lautus]MBU5348636.1 hypothetical protein [Paenibacillus lautus]
MIPAISPKVTVESRQGLLLRHRSEVRVEARRSIHFIPGYRASHHSPVRLDLKR